MYKKVKNKLIKENKINTVIYDIIIINNNIIIIMMKIRIIKTKNKFAKKKIIKIKRKKTGKNELRIKQ